MIEYRIWHAENEDGNGWVELKYDSKKPHRVTGFDGEEEEYQILDGHWGVWQYKPLKKVRKWLKKELYKTGWRDL